MRRAALLLLFASAACVDTAVERGRQLAGPRDAGAATTDARTLDTADADTRDARTVDTADAAVSASADAAPLRPDASPPLDAGTCAAAACPPGARSREEVCAAYRHGLVERADNGGFMGGAAMCDPGELSRDGLDDAFRRLTLHRWLAGLDPAGEDPASHPRAQACALMAAWNPAGPQAHSPPPSAACYTAEGAGAAGSSNIAWGNGTAARAIDQWMEDNGNESTFGHRRWLLNPPLSGVGIGAYQGGNNYGSASCITVFGGGGSSTSPPFIAYPPPGFVPEAFASMVWTIQGNVPGGALTVSIREESSGQTMPASAEALVGNYGNSSALRIDRAGWSPRRDETYTVEISGESGPTLRYAVTPIACP